MGSYNPTEKLPMKPPSISGRKVWKGELRVPAAAPDPRNSTLIHHSPAVDFLKAGGKSSMNQRVFDVLNPKTVDPTPTRYSDCSREEKGPQKKKDPTP